MTTPPIDRDAAKALLRWRLALGKEAEDSSPALRLESLAGAISDDLDYGPEELDQTLEFVYGRQKGPSRLHVPEWLARARFFR